MTQTRKPTSIFPDLPRETPVMDKNGDFNNLWSLGFSSLFQALQKNFSNEGLSLPLLTDTEINSIQALYTPYVGGSYETLVANLPDNTGKMVFDSVNYLPKVFIIKVSGGNVASARWWTFTIT